MFSHMTNAHTLHLCTFLLKAGLKVNILKCFFILLFHFQFRPLMIYVQILFFNYDAYEKLKT